jgi:soluble lytic murein transglycosylase-like protein
MALAFSSAGLVGCKKQPAATVETAEQQAIRKAKADLTALLNNNTLTADELEAALAPIKALNLTDPEVVSLIAQVEQKIANKRADERLKLEEERKRLEAERLARERENAPENRLRRLFDQISTAGSPTAADAAINQALEMFSSPNADVLVIISRASNGEPDYDRPTNIKKYLEYLKDQKKKADAIENIVYDNNGKIKELELTKLK